MAEKKAEQTVPELVRRGTQIIIPEGMNLAEAAEWIEIKAKEDERTIGVMAEFNSAYPLDAANAMTRAIENVFGWSQTGTATNPFTGKTHATAGHIQIPNSHDSSVPVLLGEFTLPGMDGSLKAGFDWGAPTPAFMINGELKMKDRHLFDTLVAATRKELKENSLYRAKAVRVSWDWMRNDKSFHPIEHAPKFLDLGNVEANGLIFANDIQRSLDLGLFAPIERSSTCRAYGIPLKRGVLLEGPYGTGKTLTALVTAVKANRYGWTFLYLNSVADLEQGLRLAAQYEPCVVFVEDVDNLLDSTINSAGQSMAVKHLTTLLDGVDNKSREIITVFTTNHVEKIDRAFLRPGRLDTVVHVDPPDANAAIRLVNLYGGEHLECLDPEEWEAIGQALAGKIPSVIREVIERSKLAAITRVANGEAIPPVTSEDILSTAALMEQHLRLMSEEKKEEKSTFRLEFDSSSFEPVQK